MADIFLLAGAPAVGKSTTARALAKHFSKSIHIPVDNIREMVISGVIHPGGDWSPGLVEQLRLARETVTRMALSYNQAGFSVVIDDFWDPKSLLHEYQLLFEQPTMHKVLLFPSQRAAEERNLNRSGSGDASEYIAEGIRLVYEHLQTELPALERQGWAVVDTTEKNVDLTVSHILARAG